jgi:hypothetical protein
MKSLHGCTSASARSHAPQRTKVQLYTIWETCFSICCETYERLVHNCKCYSSSYQAREQMLPELVKVA